MSEDIKNTTNEESEQILELIDEDGNTVPFEHLDTVKLGDEEYIVCIPYDEDEDEVTEIVLFKIDKDAGSDDCLSQVIDDDLAAEIYEEFKKRNADNFDFED